MVSPALSRVWQHVKLSDALSWGPSAIEPRVDEDVKKPTKQTKIDINKERYR